VISYIGRANQSTQRKPPTVASHWQTLSQCCIEYKVKKSVAMYKRGLILRGTIIAVFYNEIYVEIWTPGSSFVQSLPPFPTYSTYNIQHCYCCCSKWFFLKADLNKLWNPYCLDTWTCFWHNPDSNQLLGQRFGWPLCWAIIGRWCWPNTMLLIGPTSCPTVGTTLSQCHRHNQTYQVPTCYQPFNTAH